MGCAKRAPWAAVSKVSARRLSGNVAIIFATTLPILLGFAAQAAEYGNGLVVQGATEGQDQCCLLLSQRSHQHDRRRRPLPQPA